MSFRWKNSDVVDIFEKVKTKTISAAKARQIILERFNISFSTATFYRHFAAWTKSLKPENSAIPSYNIR